MNSMLALFNAALGLTEPWHVTSTEFSAGERRLDVSVAFRTGSKFIGSSGELVGILTP